MLILDHFFCQDIITLAHPGETYMHKYGRLGEAPVPRSRA